jgi:DNA-binding MarR family transcriptional regulator
MDRVSWILIRLSTVWRKRMARQLATQQLSLNQFAALCCLAESGPLFHRELAERLKTHEGDLAVALDPLQERILISRDMDNRDRRRVELKITSLGLRFLASVERALECEDKLLAGLFPEERATLRALLVRLLAD